ncbi:BaiN/RdsA family NAD(P)/FAD-dependent oxidoreductase [Alteribacillus iranensis]|uniref:Aminoacetone oxidase family FAD-binding enzyme n=1 Tax=Alteribacillus iranensis TaxID=930128 RepID=A0A1I2ES85_9BACI|nr:NAD(P)/FAD-dependent oxidoreductase [Alteribacillus iranensis]SFE95308.1 hypothetical protein SAMN05192532_106204 [Alteribacillus iranensis]
MNYDTIIIGGGPSGLMAAVGAAEHGSKVLLVEKGKKLGRKLAISGGGRCNVTNRMDQKELIEHIPGNGKFMYSPFSIFNNEDIISFFEGLGIPLKEEDMGRMFPVNDKAITVVHTLLQKIKDLNVKTLLETRVSHLLYEKDKVTGISLEDGSHIHAKSVIVATGGKSVPHTGSTGDGYPWAESAGHTITDLYPTEVPITSEEPFIKDKRLQGLSLGDAELSVYQKKRKQVVSHRGGLVFTHFGVSGPIVLRCSQFVVKQLKKSKEKEVQLGLNTFPDTNEEEMFQQLVHIKKKDGAKTSKNGFKSLVAERLLLFFLEKSGIPFNQPLRDISNDSLRRLAQHLTDFRFMANGTLSLEKAFVTGGGVSIKEIHPKRMESKFKQGLFFCGEILDIHAYTGGFNITCAFSTGYTAGKAAADYLNDK